MVLIRRRTVLLILALAAGVLGAASGLVGVAAMGWPLAAWSAPVLWVLWLALCIRHNTLEERLFLASKHCLTCGYPANGVPSDLCPECGCPWEQVPRWMGLPSARTVVRTVIVCWVVTAALGVIGPSLLK